MTKETKYLSAAEARDYDPARILNKLIKETEDAIIKIAKQGNHEVLVPLRVYWDARDVGKLPDFKTHFQKMGFGVRDYTGTAGGDQTLMISWKDK